MLEKQVNITIDMIIAMLKCLLFSTIFSYIQKIEFSYFMAVKW